MNSRLHHPLDSVGSTCKLCSLYAVCVALYRCAEVVKDVLEAPPFACLNGVGNIEMKEPQNLGCH
jgi:hypothetical protein